MLNLFLQNLASSLKSLFSFLEFLLAGNAPLFVGVIIGAISLGILLYVSLSRWLASRQTKYLREQPFTLLAIDIPSIGEQSPKAVEQIFSHLSSAAISKPKFKERWGQGVVQIPLSFEIISIEGSIQFLIHTPEVHRDFVEAAIYAQYPDAEIYEVEDYATTLPDHWPNDAFDIWAADLVLERDEYYPIRTYPYFEHQFFKKFNDPLAALLEAMGKLETSEQAWVQYVLTPHTETKWKEAGEKKAKEIAAQKPPPKKKNPLKSLSHMISGGVDTVVNTIIPPGKPSPQSEKKEEKGELTKGEEIIIEAIQAKVAKIGYKTKIRIIYWGTKQAFNKMRRVASLLGAFRQYTSLNLNGFKSGGKKPSNTEQSYKKFTHIVYAYKQRAKGDKIAKPFILNTEELASLWHFPSPDIGTQRVKRTAGRKFGAPENLPIAPGENAEEQPIIQVSRPTLEAPMNLPV